MSRCFHAVAKIPSSWYNAPKEKYGMKVHLREWRFRRLLSQRDLAKKAKVGLSTIVRVEKGDYRPTMRTLRRLAKALDIEPDQLVDWGDEV
jgi:DNA-binding XRE family transcriptional regulator